MSDCFDICANVYSLVNSIGEGHGSPTVGTPAAVSTVGIEIHRHQLKGTKGTAVEFYDCAGQIDYFGLHQTFLTRRALYLLVWDVSKCLGKQGEELDEVRQCQTRYRSQQSSRLFLPTLLYITTGRLLSGI